MDLNKLFQVLNGDFKDLGFGVDGSEEDKEGLRQEERNVYGSTHLLKAKVISRFKTLDTLIQKCWLVVVPQGPSADVGDEASFLMEEGYSSTNTRIQQAAG